VNRLSHLRWLLCSVYVLLCWAGISWAENWPYWRGPDNNGISRETRLPAEWTETKNVLWKVPLPGLAGSPPILWDSRLFLTSSEGRDLILLCLNTDGKTLWKGSLGAAGRTVIKGGEANEASASPSTDGKHVWAFAGNGTLACFALDGKEIWKINVQDRSGRFQIQHGMHSTPLLHEGRLYLSLLHSGGHWVIALDKATGKEVWKVARKSDAQSESKEAYTSPGLWQNGKETCVVVLGCDYTTAHRLSDGSEIWRLADLNPKTKYHYAFRIISSPVASPDLLVVPTARGGPVAAIKPGASGLIKVGSPGAQWHKPKGSPDVPSPLVHDGLVYLCREMGLLQCWDAKTGQELYQQRLHAARYRASPVYADGKIYLTARDGTFSVVKAGPKFELLAENVLTDAFAASPVIANGRIYLRGFRSLYAISEGGK